MVAPPLLWLGAPFFPMLRGLPEPIRTYWVAPLVQSPSIRRHLTRLTHPKFALPVLLRASWGWHLPAAYEVALRSSGWHYLHTPVSSALVSCSGIPSSVPIRAGPDGRSGCCFRS